MIIKTMQKQVSATTRANILWGAETARGDWLLFRPL